MSLGFSEKYATSEPEIKAEDIMSNIRMIISIGRVTGDPENAVGTTIPVRESDRSVSKVNRFG
jgi:hypothetical protein